MDTRRKIGLGIMMGLGVIAGALGFYKCSKLPALASPKTDFTWATAPLLYWSSIEANCVIIAACIPTVSPITKLFANKTKHMVSSSNYFVGGRSHGKANSAPLRSSGVFGGSSVNKDGRGDSRAGLTSLNGERHLGVKRNTDGWLELNEVETGSGAESSSTKKGFREHSAAEVDSIGAAS